MWLGSILQTPLQMPLVCHCHPLQVFGVLHASEVALGKHLADCVTLLRSQAAEHDVRVQALLAKAATPRPHQCGAWCTEVRAGMSGANKSVCCHMKHALQTCVQLLGLL